MKIDNLFFKVPKALHRLGDDLFLKLPLFQKTKKVKPIYINKSLFAKMFPFIGLSWADMSSFIADQFSITLKPEISTGFQVGWAYVDRQADPLETALSGNLGSGRAYYTGEYFNIKGEKTPLATSPLPYRSHGGLLLSEGLWGTCIANTFYEEMTASPSPVLALVDLYEDHVLTNDDGNHSQKIPKVQAIRLDLSGELDRVSHLFYKKTGLSSERLQKVARNFARYEAEKFSIRMLHGSWSTGNISLEGHLIDCDSVCVVKGRHPQWQVTSRYVSNYFGLEYQGQAEILKSLVEEPLINISNFSEQKLRKIFMKELYHQLARQLVHLMGYQNIEAVYQYASNDLLDLTSLFFELSRYTYYKKENSAYTRFPLHLWGHVFDFSSFFRSYPLMCLKDKFSLITAFETLAKTDLLIDENTVRIPSFDSKNRLPDSVVRYLKKYSVTQPYQLEKIKESAFLFIKKYHNLFQKISQKFNTNLFNLANRAYVINEDRIYLFPIFKLDIQIELLLANNKIEEVNNFLQSIIDASKRLPIKGQDNSYRSDIKLFKEGSSGLCLNDGYFQIYFAITEEKLIAQWRGKGAEKFNIKSFNQEIGIDKIYFQEQTITIYSKPISIIELLDYVSRDATFKTKKNYSLYYEKEKIILTNLYTDKYINFSYYI